MYPDATAITCTRDDECPERLACHPSAHRCLDPARVDTQPPQIIATRSTDPTHVAITFDEAIDPSASEAAALTIDPTLEVGVWELDPDGREVTLEVGAQTPGTSYNLAVRGFADLYGNAIADSAQSFTGFGAFPERDPPTILGPSAGDPLTDDDVTLVWSPRSLATRYTVEIATDVDFAQPIAASPCVVDAPQTTCTVTVPDPVRYYWRVRADTTTPGLFSVSSFDKVGSTLYVYCPSDAARCDDAGFAGNVSAPLRTLAGAAVRASLIGATTVLVAERGGDAAYTGGVALSGAFAMLGGYDSTFDVRDSRVHVTHIESASVPGLIVLGSTGDLTLDGFTVTAPQSDGISVRGVYSGHVVLRNLVVAAGNAAFSIADSDTTQPDRVRVDGCTTSALLGAGLTVGIGVTQAAVTIANNVIADTGRGIAVERGNVIIAANTIDVDIGQYATASGIYAFDSDLTIRDNSVRVTAIADDVCALKIDAGVNETQRCEIVNNVFESKEAPSLSRNFIGASATHVIVTNNLFIASASAITVPLQSFARVTGESVIVDNIFANSAANALCVQLFDYAELTDLRGNAFVGCSGNFYQYGSTLLTRIVDVNNPALLGQSPTPAGGGNYEVASFGALGLDATYHLTSATPANIRFGGIDTRTAKCGRATNTSCGNVTNDKAGAARTCPSAGACVSIGPFERDVP